MINELQPVLNIPRRKLIIVVLATTVFLAATAVVLSFQGLQAIYPIIFVGFIVFFITDKNNTFVITWLDVGFGVLLISEIITTLFSAYFFNSLSSLNRFVALLFLYVLFKRILKVFRSRYPLFLLFFFFSFVLLIITFYGFFSFKNGIVSAGFSEIDNFKGYQKPLIIVKNGILNNIWASALLIFIPFNMIFLMKVKKWWQKIVVIGALLLNIFGLIVTFSRGVYLSLFFFVIILNVFSLRLLTIKKLLIYNLLALLMIASSAFIVKDPFLTTVSLNKTSSQQRSTRGRLDQWKYVLDNIDEKPVFGYGQKNFRLAKGNAPLVAEDVVFTNRTNNTYLQILIERGIVGFISHLFFFWLILLIVLKNLKSKKRSREEKLEITLLFAGMAAFLFRELTFSSLFDGEIVFFLAFYLIFNLVPYDIKLKEIKFSGLQKKVLAVAGVSLVTVIILFNVRRATMVFYANKSVESYYKNEIENSLAFIDKAFKISPSDMELHNSKAIVLSKSSLEITISAENPKFLSFEKADTAILKLSLVHLNKVLEETPKNDIILQNVGWAYLALNDMKHARQYFEKAIVVNPYVGSHHVSLGLLNLYQLKIDEATKNTGNALKYSPYMLESVFFTEFLKKFPENAREAKQMAISYLTDSVQANNNPILKARLARLLMDENPTESYKLYQEVTAALPNLIRPWVYLAQLNISNGNSEQAENCYRKARFLGQNDYYTFYYLAQFYESLNREEQAAGLYKNSLSNYREIRYYAHSKYTSIPKMRTIPADYFNTGLLYFIKPKIDAAEIFWFLAEYNRKKNDFDKVLYYEELSEKYKNKVYNGSENIR